MATDYKARHVTAMDETTVREARFGTAHECAIVALYKAWRMYAKAHLERYDSQIGADYVLGDHWKDIGLALLGLLNGECGRLDCGTMDRAIREAMASAGISAEDAGL